MKDYCKILNEIIKAYYDEEYPEYFQDEVYKIFKGEGITKGYKVEPIVRCKDCKYFKVAEGERLCGAWEEMFYNPVDENGYCYKAERKDEVEE